MRPLRYIPSYTLEDYRQWEGDWELIDGLPYAMTPSPIRKHQVLSSLLLRQLGQSISNQKQKCGSCIEVHELDWIINNTTVLRPDIAVICNQTDDFITAAPELIIEIISPATALKDRQLKFEIYQEEGVLHYIIIDPSTKKFNIFLLVNGQYIEQPPAVFFNIHNGCTIHIDIEKALAELV